MESKETLEINEPEEQKVQALPPPADEEKEQDNLQQLKAELEELKDKHIRLYAEFENYKKKIQKDKDELLMYSNESLIYELLPIIDTLEMAISHSLEKGSDINQSLLQGVENTLREFKRTLEKFGLKQIEARGKEFDPTYHHAMSQVESDDFLDNHVVEEFRKGYMLHNKILRPSLVSVSKKAQKIQ
ncbi:MAG: nucleotide exchange factor GrpE [Thermodesulfovibrionales bacterium]|nr:nucleotide exchange factor GrpE [Thermodesulfovibrionales bacterium]